MIVSGRRRLFASEWIHFRGHLLIAQLVPIINSYVDARWPTSTIKKKREGKDREKNNKDDEGNVALDSRLLPRCTCTREFSPIGGKSVLRALSWDATREQRHARILAHAPVSIGVYVRVCYDVRLCASVRDDSQSTRSRESPTADGWRHSAGCYRCLRTSVAICGCLSAAID